MLRNSLESDLSTSACFTIPFKILCPEHEPGSGGESLRNVDQPLCYSALQRLPDLSRRPCAQAFDRLIPNAKADSPFQSQALDDFFEDPGHQVRQTDFRKRPDFENPESAHKVHLESLLWSSR